MKIFRHGDRTNDLETIYPKDPFKNDSYYPYGYGQLTQTGKLKMYKLGAVLRQKYGDFLGDFYSSRFVHSRCSSYSRTKISLMLVMAGLFPPKNEQIWSPDLNWQPFTFDYKLKMHDLVFMLEFSLHCRILIELLRSSGILWHHLPKLLQTLLRLLQNKEVPKLFEKVRPLV